ncbi:hypothetical protein [Streptomyces sp. NPDC097619]|uniref:hypothetical protein n=1 Tax=Streptomyces sp. NPDC097619 TaxID=3157228 RepID=UPI003327CD26
MTERTEPVGAYGTRGTGRGARAVAAAASVTLALPMLVGATTAPSPTPSQSSARRMADWSAPQAIDLTGQVGQRVLLPLQEPYFRGPGSPPSEPGLRIVLPEGVAVAGFEPEDRGYGEVAWCGRSGDTELRCEKGNGILPICVFVRINRYVPGATGEISLTGIPYDSNPTDNRTVIRVDITGGIPSDDFPYAPLAAGLAAGLAGLAALGTVAWARIRRSRARGAGQGDGRR